MRFITIFTLVLVALTVPLSLFAQASTPQTPGYLIVCDPAPAPGTGSTNDCHFDDLIRLGVNIINFLIVLSTALAAIGIAYAGFLMLSSGGDEGKVKQAKSMLTKIVIGLIFVIAGWVIVNTVIVALLDPNQPGLFILRP